WAQSVYERIRAVNDNWARVGRYTASLEQDAHIKNEQQLVQTHLLYALDYLGKQIHTLSATQSANRTKCLDILQAYAYAGRFPINTYHAQRTPYFIDSYSTYCAVGYLLQQTGYDAI